MNFEKTYKNLFEGLKSGTFLHASNTGNLTKETINVPDVKDREASKPWGGLWLTPKTEWTKFNIKELFGIKKYTHLYKLKLDLSGIKVLYGTSDEIPKKYKLQYDYINWYDYIKDNKLNGIYFKDNAKDFYPMLDVESLVLFNKDNILKLNYLGDYKDSINKRVKEHPFNK